MAKDVKDYGTIVFFKNNYGFITPDGGGNDAFFHISSVPDDKEIIRKGARVSYYISPDKRNSAKVAAMDDCP